MYVFFFIYNEDIIGKTGRRRRWSSDGREGERPRVPAPCALLQVISTSHKNTYIHLHLHVYIYTRYA